MEIGSIIDGLRYKNFMKTNSIIDDLRQKKFIETCSVIEDVGTRNSWKPAQRCIEVGA